MGSAGNNSDRSLFRASNRAASGSPDPYRYLRRKSGTRVFGSLRPVRRLLGRNECLLEVGRPRRAQASPDAARSSHPVLAPAGSQKNKHSSALARSEMLVLRECAKTNSIAVTSDTFPG